MAWRVRQERMGERALAANKVAEAETERGWKVWVLARHGNLRGVEIARQLGYKDGSAIHIL